MAYKDSIKPATDGFLKSISIIHLALLAGQVIFALAAFTQSTTLYFGFTNKDDLLIYVVPVLAIGGFMSGHMLFNQQLNNLGDKNILGEKVIAYQTALITRFALLEAPSLFAIAAFMLRGNLFYLAVAGLLMLYFLFLRPTKQTMENDLDLNFKETVMNCNHQAEQ
ncbi:MAG: hypothetical protein JWP78_1454 [Mucilaginibacter sp.]|nr:hypothetical protein [Mucilaginibacter sp.]